MLCEDVFKNYDIIALVETFAIFKDQYTYDGYVSFGKCRKRNIGAKRNSGGINVMIRKDIAKHFKALHTTSNDILFLRATNLFSCGDILMGICYCSPIYSKATDGNFYSDLEENLYFFIDQYPNDKVVLMGDFNGRTGNLSDVLGNYLDDTRVFTNNHGAELLQDTAYVPPRTNSDNEINAYGRNLIGICQEFNLCLCNGRLGEDKNIGNFTCINHQGASVVDYVLVPHNLIPYICKFEVSDIADYSIHFPLTFVLESKQASVKGPGAVSRSSPQLEKRIKYKWNEQMKLDFLAKLEVKKTFIDTLKPTNKQEIDTSVTALYDIIEQCAGDMKIKVGSSFTKKNETSQQHAPFFDEDCVKAKSKMKTALKNFRKASKQKRRAEQLNDRLEYFSEQVNDKLIEFHAAKSDYKILVKEKKRIFIKERENLAQSFTENSNEFWSFYKKNKKSNASHRAIEEIKPDQWKNHLENLFSAPSGIRVTEIIEPNREIDTTELDKEISVGEVEAQIKKLKDNKSPGPDGLCSQFFKIGIDFLINFIFILFNSILNIGYYPLKWTDSLVFMLHKKGLRSDANNYRSISLLNIISKMFAGIMHNRLFKWCNRFHLLSENQFGFRAGRSTVDCLFIHDALIQQHLRKKRGKLFACYIDFSKAFDTVSWEILWSKLEKLGISRQSKFLRALKAMYNRVSCSVITPWGLTEGIRLHKGVRQGCILSPLLFALFIDDIKEWLSELDCHECNFQGNTPITHLLFADDLVLFSQSIIGLQKMINCLSEFCDRFSMKINLDKTKIMVFRNGGRHSRKEKWYLDGREIEVVSKFRYLGLTISNSGVWTAAQSELANRATKGLFCIKSFLYNSKITNIKVATKLFDSCIIPILNYGGEIWGFNRGNDIDRVSDNFYKFITKLPRNANNITARGELGRPRAHYKRYLRIIKYWLKLICDAPSPPVFVKLAYQSQRNMDAQGHIVWASDVRTLLSVLGFSGEWSSQRVSHPKSFLVECKKRLLYIENIYFMKNIPKAPRLQFYFHNKFQLELANYWDFQLPFIMKSEFCRFLCSCHNLSIEMGRKLNVPREDRFCSLCNLDVVEDEVHFLLVCPALQDIRVKYIPTEYCVRPGLNAAVSLLINPERKEGLIKFCFYGAKRRDKLIITATQQNR